VGENVDVWRIALDPASGIARGSFERVTSDAAADQMMNVSNDGALLAFISTRTRQSEVWVRDMSIGRDRQITFAGGDGARLSRNGSLVAVNHSAAQPNAELVPT